MPFNFPTYQTLVARIRSAVSANLPGVDPTIFGSVIRAFTDSLAGRAFDIVILLKQLLNRLFPTVDDPEGLELWASYEGLTRQAATGSSGDVTFEGTVGSTIPLGTQLSASNGELYETQATVDIAAVVASISSITRSGSVATVTTTSDHSFATGLTVTIAGADQSYYNGAFKITVTDTDEFEYTVSGAPATPATGTITAACDCASVEVDSVGTGAVTKLSSGAQLGLVSPIAGVDTTSFVQFLGLVGGADTETDESLLSRTIQSRANPVANFNIAAIEKEALKISGVTRVKVKRITPRIGAVTILFIRDNDDNPIPSAGEVQEVEDQILTILPATSDETDVVVTAPTPVSTDYTFSALSPDTATMRTAIEQNLIAFYEDEVTFETTITEDKYRAAIIDTVDPETGDSLSSFTLTTPTTDITVTTDEIGVLGTVSFP